MIRAFEWRVASVGTHYDTPLPLKNFFFLNWSIFMNGEDATLYSTSLSINPFESSSRDTKPAVNLSRSVSGV